MKPFFIQEPELQFGQDRHIDIRFGISNYKPLDYRENLAPKSIPLGIVGTERNISDLRGWLDTCAKGIEAKASNQPNLFPRFPGFGEDTPFDSKLVFDSRLERQVSTRDLPKSVSLKEYNKFITELADTYVTEAEACSTRGASVVVCALPIEALNLIDPDEAQTDDPEAPEATETLEQDFHDLLKARAMQAAYMKPLQIVLPMTYQENVRHKKLRKKTETRKLQDPATRAWNFHTALYYKAGGTPWRLIREEADVRAMFKKIPSVATSVHMNELIEETISFVHHEAQRKNVSLRADLGAGLPTVGGDRVQLEQVILNLMMNGIESMAGLDSEPKRLLIRSALPNPGKLLVSVADTGPGIDAEHANRLFAPFFTTKPQGIGMGLPICRSIIEAHGGRLWAENNESGGAVFHFMLPIKAPSE
jgi:hypothetical protein